MSWLEGLIEIVLQIFTDSKAQKQTNETRSINDDTELRMSKYYRNIGIGWITVGLIFFIVSLLTLVGFEKIFIILFALMLFGIGFVILMYYRNQKLTINRDKLIITNWLGKSKEIKWIEINNFKIHPISGYLNIYSKEKIIKIDRNIVGLQRLINKLEKNIKNDNDIIDFSD